MMTAKILTVQEAIELGASGSFENSEDFKGVVYVERADGSEVAIQYFPIGAKFRARRVRKSGLLGASKDYSRDKVKWGDGLGWIDALNHQLQKKYRIN